VSASSAAAAPLCLITGVGEGTGAALVRRFAAGGYRVAMLARSADRLQRLAAEVPGAIPFACEVGDEAALRATLAELRSHHGDPQVVIHNAVAAVGLMRSFREISTAQLRTNFGVNTAALLVLAQELTPAMERAGQGAVLVTGNTGAWRGVPGYASFAPSKAAQRILAESLARDLGPRGVHVACIVVDAFIDMPAVRQRLHPDKPDEFFAKPAAIAEEFFRVAHQDRSAWSFNVELRPFGERW
jgi:NAD(P)-dependent dehydrogenase (short-subunit alcohol dehydrogenase family)